MVKIPSGLVNFFDCRFWRMDTNTMGGLLLTATALLAFNAANAETAPAAKPEHGEYRDWRVLGVSLRHD